MIKCNVTVCGTITRSAQMRTNKDGKAFLAFGVSVVIAAKSGINKTFEISVAKDGGMDELNGLASGTRVEMTGVLTFHKKDDTIFLNMSATNVSTANVSADDSVKGAVEPLETRLRRRPTRRAILILCSPLSAARRMVKAIPLLGCASCTSGRVSLNGCRASVASMRLASFSCPSTMTASI